MASDNASNLTSRSLTQDPVAGEPIDPSSSKRQIYDKLLREAASLFEGQRNWVWSVKHSPASSNQCSRTPLTPSTGSNLSNTSSLLYHAYASLPRSSPSHHVNWAGFYTLNPISPATSPSLILGPFQGRLACQTIAFNRGVCGTAAAERRTVRVYDVHEFPGHIACDERSRSEIVVPILRAGEVVAIIDIDCAEVGGFDEVDEEYLGRLANLLAESCEWAS